VGDEALIAVCNETRATKQGARVHTLMYKLVYGAVVVSFESYLTLNPALVLGTQPLLSRYAIYTVGLGTGNPSSRAHLSVFSAAPKRKALEHDGETGGHTPPVFVIDIARSPQAYGTMTRDRCDKAAIGDPAFSLSGPPGHMP
jgi:hypothetical protein